MLQSLARKFFDSFLMLALLATLVFFTLRLAPGGPFDSEKAFPPAVKANIEAKYGLDLPVWKQFAIWTRDLLQGDLHESFQYLGRPVTTIIRETLPISATLGAAALVLSLVLGVFAGVLAASLQGTSWDQSVLLFSIAGVSLPSYLVASILILIFSVYLGWLPAGLWEGPQSAILPILTLALRPFALIARLVRSSMLESLHSDYIRTARGKGAPEHTVLFKHALSNSWLPAITLVGPIAANLVTGSFLVETVFQIPGTGRYFVNAVMNRDYPLVMGVTLVYGVILVVTNRAVDFTYHWIDPRIRLDQKDLK